jgi:hypothetical protein
MWGMGWDRIMPLGGALLFIGFAKTMLHLSLVAAIIPAILVLPACFITVKERKAIEYVRLAFGYLLEAKTWIAPLAMARLGKGKARPSILQLPPELSGLEFRETIINGEKVGAIETGKGKSRSVICVMELSSTTPFLLLTPEEQAQLLSKWGTVLDQSATEEMRIRSLEWIVRITPSGGSEAENWALSHFSDDAAPHQSNDYMALLGQLTQAASGREYYLVVDIHAGTKKGLDAISLEVQSLLRRLKDAELSGRVLGLTEVTRLIRAMLSGKSINSVGEIEPYELAPSVRQTSWDSIHIDDTYSRSAAVHNWPSEDVSPAWLQGLLAINSPSAAYTIAVHFIPTRPSQARQRVRAAITTTEVAVQTRARSGFAASAQADRERQEARRREEQLVAGYREHRIGCVLVTSAQSLEDLEEQYQHLVHCADSTGIRLRKLYLEQKQGLVASLPLAKLSFTGGLGGW